MWCGEVLWGVFALLFLIDALRVHGRLRGIPTLHAEADIQPTHRFVRAPGIHLDERTRRQAFAHLEARDLDALELLPARVSLAMAWSMGCHIDPEAHRDEAHRPGDTGAHAFLAPAGLLDSLNVVDETPDLATFVSLSREVRRRVEKSHDLAIAPGMLAHLANPFFDPEVLRIRLGGSFAPVAMGIPMVWLLLIFGVLIAPVAGWVALICFLIQQPLALLGTGFKVRLSLGQALFRWVSDFRQWAQLLGSNRIVRDKIDALRPKYREALSQGTTRFFHPKAQTCPMCEGSALIDMLTLPDLYQGKPGLFTLSRCTGCDHRFQNPQLNVEGLNFYYRDFYDGMGEDTMDLIFGATGVLYGDRIDLVKSATNPERWLDVGCGHGHLFSHVRNALPDTRLEGLDIGDGVEAGLARGWMDEVHRGFFPQEASGLADRYDVVSMCHYLEHTIDPRAEIQAAHLVLKSGGLLLIEVPDPDGPFAKLLGKWWMPWFQPQHLHFVRTKQLEILFQEAGFESLKWQKGVANTGNDFALSFYGMVSRFAPELYVPWRPKPGIIRRISHVLIWIPGALFVAFGVVLDKICAPFARRLAHSGQYRVIARKVT